MNININVSDHFKSFVDDWDYEQQLSIGGYGSGKSYSIAQKIVLKLLKEKRKCLVVRDVYETIKESCFDLFHDILSDMDLVSETNKKGYGKVQEKQSPLEYRFPNGSRIIFRGLNKETRLKSLNGVSIVWIEECSEIKYSAYQELLGRIRTPGVSLHFILSCNPVGRECWVYRHFFTRIDSRGKETVICDEKEFYRRKKMVCKLDKNQTVLYIHSTMDDNPFLPKSYRNRIEGMKEIDVPLWIVARYGRFGATGWRVLPNFEIATNAREFKNAVNNIPARFHFFGMDFGFEESFNAVVACAVDDEKHFLYIYDEIYVNHITDDRMKDRADMHKMNQRAVNCGKVISADCEEPKTVAYYQQNGYRMRSCFKFPGSRLQYTKKMKMFKRIICSPKCKNSIREMKELTYAKDSQGNIIYDEFNIDSHCFSALWYALDTYTMSDVKQEYNSRRG